MHIRDQYYFIEKDKNKAAELAAMVKTEFPTLARQVHIKCGDANTELQGICNGIDWRYNRALLFLDPYATEVSWATLEIVAQTGSFDVWYLFPFSALNRMLRKDGNMDQSWIDCINRLLGDNGWANEFYKQDPQMNFFETERVMYYKNLNTPITLPSIWQSNTIIGSIESFSGWRR